jgi:protein-L-isoaspartate(D-aspartate) O-methyltransferase
MPPNRNPSQRVAHRDQSLRPFRHHRTITKEVLRAYTVPVAHLVHLLPGVAAILVILAACGADHDAENPALAAVPTSQRAARADWPPKHGPDGRDRERHRMVESQIMQRGVEDEPVLNAMRVVPRHLFVPKERQGEAYADRPLPIGEDQTISQPYIVASMTEQLRLTKEAKVLEIGTGSGYQAAILAQITPQVYTMEIKRTLAETAAERLRALGYTTVRARQGDGYFGWAEAAPFDAIMVTAAAPRVPPPLVGQLKPGGRLILPVGRPFATQDLMLVTKDEKGEVRTKSLYPVSFVPLTGSLR